MATNLKEFLLTKMKMSGPYQPMVIKNLILNNGEVSLDKIAEELSQKDPESQQYYKNKLVVYPKQVLANHKIAQLKEDKFRFNEDLIVEETEKEEIINICELKLKEYYEKHPIDEGKNDGWGRKRIILLEQHPFCSLCGAKPGADIELDIDHILPASKGGSDDLENLQVLCHRCNRAKGNYLLKSSKDIHHHHLTENVECVFCKLPPERILFENDYIKAIWDIYPVSMGHTLYIPKRHIQNAFELNDQEMLWIFKLAKIDADKLKAADPTIDGFNAGFNIGTAAGQSVMHVHFHLIPRRTGDTPEAFGGIRNVIAGKGKY
jgi:ATP adenylyltransferase